MKKHGSRFAKAVVVSLGLFSAAVAHGGDAGTDLPAVVRLHTQVCDGGGLTQAGWTRHPSERDYQRLGSMPFGDTGYRIDFRQLGPFREWTILERLHDKSRGVDDSYALFSRSGLTPYRAAYVITRMPPSDEPISADKFLMMGLLAQKRNDKMGKASFIEIETPFGKGIEMIVGGRVGSTCFPTSAFHYAETPEESSFGISRFVVRGKDLIEYAMVLRWPEGLSHSQMIERGRTELKPLENALVVDSTD